MWREGITLRKSDRRSKLVEYLKDNPFATDEQLAELFSVSVATIRLDRIALQIPEVRERIRQMASDRRDDTRALAENEIVGELLELRLGRFAISQMQVQNQHVFSKSGIMRGHFLFAQVNSLATALMDAEEALTGKAEVRFYRPVHLGESLRARVDVVDQRADTAKCRVRTQVANEVVLDGVIWINKRLDTLVQVQSEEEDR